MKELATEMYYFTHERTCHWNATEIYKQLKSTIYCLWYLNYLNADLFIIILHNNWQMIVYISIAHEILWLAASIWLLD